MYSIGGKEFRIKHSRKIIINVFIVSDNKKAFFFKKKRTNEHYFKPLSFVVACHVAPLWQQISNIHFTVLLLYTRPNTFRSVGIQMRELHRKQGYPKDDTLSGRARTKTCPTEENYRHTHLSQTWLQVECMKCRTSHLNLGFESEFTLPVCSLKKKKQI